MLGLTHILWRSTDC